MIEAIKYFLSSIFEMCTDKDIPFFIRMCHTGLFSFVLLGQIYLWSVVIRDSIEEPKGMFVFLGIIGGLVIFTKIIEKLAGGQE